MIRLKKVSLIFSLILLMGVSSFAQSTVSPENYRTETIPVFQDDMVHFNPENPSEYNRDGITSEDNGRMIVTSLAIPSFEHSVKIIAHLTLKPIPKDERSVHDRWDRAGNIRLRREGQPDLEIIRFMTSYGGRTTHELDVSHLAPILSGECEFAAFMDTWVSPAWKIDFSLEFEETSEWIDTDWVQPLLYINNFTNADHADGVTVTVTIPDSIQTVTMYYYSTGHCTDGIDEDEFISKANVISVDGVVVERYHPWRDDCEQYRDRNPYCARWSDGYWSSDYSRSGWCPGAEVIPLEIELADHLTPGVHTITVNVENMRPRDENGHHGYWIISAFLVGWCETPMIWRNWDE